MIKICIPYYSAISQATLDSVDAIGKTGLQYILAKSQGTNIYKSREMLITNGSVYKTPKLEKRFDKYFLLDADISFTINQFNALMALSKKYPVCSLSYELYGDGESNKSCCGYFDSRHPGGLIKEFLPLSTRGIKKVDFCGTGMMMVDREVFEKIGRPYFPPLNVVHGGKMDITSCDVGFAVRLKENNIPIYVDMSCVVKHRRVNMADEAKEKEKRMSQEKKASIEDGINAVVLQCSKLSSNIQAMGDTILALARENAQLKQQLEEKPNATRNK
jgi:hypothetical protein